MIKQIRWVSTLTLLLSCAVFSQELEPLSDVDTNVILEISNEITVSDSVQNDTSPSITQMPRILDFVKAEYPQDLIKKGISGSVLLDLLVSETGVVDSASIVKGVHPVLDSNALKASLRFRFSPAMAGKDSVAVLLQYEYHFTLDDAVDSIPQISNFSGVILEKGTRISIPDAMIAITFDDTVSDKSLPLPFKKYIEKIGSIPGQNLEDGRLVTVSDSNGRFTFHSLPSCTLKIQVIIAGYQKYSTTEVISAKEQIEAKYYVPKLNYSDFEIVIYGKAEEKEVSRRQLTIQEIRKIPGLGGDAVKVVQAMPGVARPAFMSGAVVVRGAPTWDSKFYLDGISIPVLYHYGGLKSTYNSDALEGVDFLPGGFGTRYGGGIAGVIEMRGKEATKERWHGNLDLSTLDGSFFVEGPINKKISILASARRSFIGDIAELITKKFPDYFAFTMSTFYWDYVFRTDISLSKNNHVFLTFFGTRDSLAVVAPDVNGGSDEISDAKNKLGMNITSHLAMAGWDWKISNRLTNNAVYSLATLYSSQSPFGFARAVNDGIQHSIREQLSFEINPKLKLTGGLDLNYAIVDVDLAISDGYEKIDRSKIKDWLFGQTAAYLNLEWKPDDKWLFIPGIRYDYYSELKHDGTIIPELWNYNGFNNDRGISGDPSLRLSTKYKINDIHTVKAAIGNYNQTPQPLGQAIHPSWGNPLLSSTKAVHYVLGHEWKITDVINSDIQFYFNNQWDIPELGSDEDLVNNGQAQNLFLNKGRGRMYGLEIMLRHLQTEKFFGWVAYTLSRTERFNRKVNDWQLYDQDETHHLQVLGSWHLKKQWDLGFRLRFVSGKPTTPIIGRTFNEEWQYFQAEYPEQENTDRFDPFVQLDFRVDKKIIKNRWIYSFYVDLQNISYFLYKSPELVYYSWNYKDKETFSMFPMFGIGSKIEF